MANRVGWTVVGLVTVFMLLDTVAHFANPAPIVEASVRLGLPIGLAPVTAAIELVCLVAYLTPRTSILGAILMTGYLGGAVATHLRAGSSVFGEVLFPVYVGALVWGGLYLTNTQLRALIPLKRT